MADRDFLLLRLVDFYKKIKSEKRINYAVLNIINLYNFAIHNKENLIKCTNIKKIFDAINFIIINDILNNPNLHNNLKYLLNEKINIYNEVYL